MNNQNKGLRWLMATLSADELLKEKTIEYTVREEMRDSVNLVRIDELWRWKCTHGMDHYQSKQYTLPAISIGTLVHI